MQTALLKAQLESVVARLEDEYGSEHSGGGFVYETTASNVADAIEGITPETAEGVTIESKYDREYVVIKAALTDMDGNPTKSVVVVPMKFEEFKKDRSEPEEEPEDEEMKWLPSDRQAEFEEFVALIEPYKPLYARAGGDDFDEDDGSPGLFYECFLIVTGEEKNFLVAFPCVWT
jgi:hypothetical protein